MVTGIDIIKEQIWIAYTGKTALEQSDIVPRGHAIECRINAEDASKNFQPSPGIITMCHQPLVLEQELMEQFTRDIK